jgi:hypothetical protein
VEDGAVMIQSITYVKPYEDKKEGAFTPSNYVNEKFVKVVL